MKKKILLIVIFLSKLSLTFSQIINFKKNAISIELPSYVCNYSLNYERVLKEKKWIVVGKVGVYYQPVSNKGGNQARDGSAFLVGLDFYKGFRRHYFTLGSSLAYVREIDWTKEAVHKEKVPYKYALTYIPLFGYRYQKKAKGISYRVMFMPFQTDITPRTQNDQINKNYFVYRPVYLFLGSFGIGYSF